MNLKIGYFFVLATARSGGFRQPERFLQSIEIDFEQFATARRRLPVSDDSVNGCFVGFVRPDRLANNI